LLLLVISEVACNKLFDVVEIGVSTGKPLVVKPISPDATLPMFIKEYFTNVHAKNDLVLTTKKQPQIVINGLPHDHFEVYQQHYKGVPIEGAEVKIAYDSSNKIISISSHLIDDIDLDVVPHISEKIAINKVENYARLMSHPNSQDPLPKDLKVFSTQLIIYRTGLSAGFIGTNIVSWDVRLESTSHKFQKYSFVIDANSGDVVVIRSLTKSALYREVREYPSTNAYWVEGDNMPSQEKDFEAYSFLNAAKDFYNTLYNMYHWKSYDNLDAALIGNVYMEDDSICPNAFFDPDTNQTFFCTGLSRYDIATHELGHALTSCMDNGIYEYMSGALQEAWSDTIAETFSQFWNGSGYYPPRDTVRSCVDPDGPGKRWICGDNCDMFDNGLRDLYNPECYGNPSTVSDMICYPYDLSGVHSNCGVPSVLYSVLSDGGIFKGHNYVGIGLLKAFSIFFAAKLSYQTSKESFSDYAVHLHQACIDYATTGAKLIDQYGNQTNLVVTLSDCDVLDSLIEAVGLTEEPCATYTYWGSYPMYIPMEGTEKIPIITSGSHNITEYMKVNEVSIPSAQTKEWTVLGSSSGWNQVALFDIPAFAETGALDPEAVYFTLASDPLMENQPAVDVFYSLPMQFTYYEQAVVTTLSQTTGPTSGDYYITVYGENFQRFEGPCNPITGFNYDCLVCLWVNVDDPTFTYLDFGAFVSDEAVKCIPPYGVKGTWNVALSLNMHDVSNGAIQFTFKDTDYTVLIVVICLVALACAIVLGVIIGFFIQKRAKRTGYSEVAIDSRQPS